MLGRHHVQIALVKLSAQRRPQHARHNEANQEIELDQCYKMAHIMVIILEMEKQIK
jgi:hypothetical protein